MIPNFIKTSKQILGRGSLLSPAYGREGQGRHSLLAAHFAKRNMKNCGGASEQTLSPENLKCLNWSGTAELNRDFLRPERSAITVRPVPDASIIVHGSILCYNRVEF